MESDQIHDLVQVSGMCGVLGAPITYNVHIHKMGKTNNYCNMYGFMTYAQYELEVNMIYCRLHQIFW